MPLSYRFRLKRSESHHGFSLIEVLVAVLVFSVGSLGVVTLQVKSLRHNNSAYYRTQAVIYSYEILDRIRVNRQAALNGNYDLSLSQLSDLSQPSPDAAVSAIDRYDWLRNLDGSVPGAKGALSCNTSAVCLVTVQWDESFANSIDTTKEILLATQI